MPYKPFKDGTNEIRLITILPATTESEAATDSQVHCRLDTVSLDDKFLTPTYRSSLSNTDGWRGPGHFMKLQVVSKENKQKGFEDWIEVSAPEDDATTNLPDFRYTWGDFMALSYTWGDPSITREIVVNGVSMLVTENVDACLKVFRDKPYIKNGWKLWIDALCINQKDIIERGSQVKRMREIYTKAWTPIIWLGNEEEESDNAMELIKLLAETYKTRDQVIALTQALNQEPELFGVGRWRALHQLATRRYFSRMWILQEAAQGRKNTPVLCGKKTLPWIDFSRTFGLLYKTDEVINKFITNELEAAGLEFRLSIWASLEIVGEIQLLQDAVLGHRRNNLYRLLSLGRTVFATDPRDKVYGFLGMMEPSLRDLIIPDYNATVLDVYRDFVKATIEVNGSLDVIRHSYPTTRKELPSWVPDWTVERTGAPLTFGNTTFATSGPSTADVHYLDDDKLLSCKGFKFDTFDGMGCSWNGIPDLGSILPSKGSANPYGGIEDVQEAIWRSLVANRNLESEPLKDDYSSLLATPNLVNAQFGDGDPLQELTQGNVFVWFNNVMNGNSKFRICGQDLSHYFTNPQPSEINVVHLREALMQRDRVNIGRKIVTTARGFFGLVSETTHKDDIICVLLGCTMPVALRPVGEYYKFVGECYIHGIMEGEAMEMLKRGQVQLEDIVLC
jgi:hypothetical protein